MNHKIPERDFLPRPNLDSSGARREVKAALLLNFPISRRNGSLILLSDFYKDGFKLFFLSFQNIPRKKILYGLVEVDRFMVMFV